jgi:hypothetical protein
MTTKLIAYQLENYERDYPLIRDAIKSFSGWAKLMDRVWIIKSRKSAGDIRTLLSESIHNRGKVFVIDLETNSWGSYGIDKRITSWIKENLNA